MLRLILKTPKFWYGSPDAPLVKMLSPVAWVYQVVSKYRYRLRAKKAYRPSSRVICVGNLTLGGGGKTPVVQAILKTLTEKNPAVLSRGYGGALSAKTAVLVDPSIHTVEDVGDEPLMHAQNVLCVVSQDRPTGAQFLEHLGADIIIMDDGFQNPDLQKDLSILVIDAHYGIGNGQCFPAGPLRESAKDGMRRCDAIVVIGGALPDLGVEVTCPVFTARLEVEEVSEKLKQAKSVIGFAGLAYPDKFHRTLKDMGFKIINFCHFADHHIYEEAELEELLDVADKTGATLVTTEKDYMRLRPEYKDRIEYIPVKLVMDDGVEFENFVHKKIK